MDEDGVGDIWELELELGNEDVESEACWSARWMVSDWEARRRVESGTCSS